jgi:poly-gamma-glutamate capsule biosynthesis protein CapA/YwtB (metallophosphatase superfamily)
MYTRTAGGNKPPKAAINRTTKSHTADSSAAPRIRMYAMGDMLAHDSVVGQARRTQEANNYDFTPYFQYIRPLYKDADAIFCNPETLAAGPDYGISGYPAFNAPTEFARDLRSPAGAGCNVINLATNHIGDKGQAAIVATLDVWNALKPLAIAGANRSPEEQKQIRYFSKNGIIVAFLAFADYSNNKAVSSYGLNTYHDTTLVDTLVTEARQKADAVIVSMHWGTEDSTQVNPDQISAAQHLASLGVDIVIGTGPHVLQKVTYVTGNNGHKTLVWYSLGNMLSSQLQINELTGGIAGFDIVKPKPGSGVTLTQLTFQPTFMAYDWSAADKAAGNLQARRNLTLLPLAQSEARIPAIFGPNYSAGERAAFVRATLGTEASVSIKP